MMIGSKMTLTLDNNNPQRKRLIKPLLIHKTRQPMDMIPVQRTIQFPMQPNARYRYQT